MVIPMIRLFSTPTPTPTGGGRGGNNEDAGSARRFPATLVNASPRGLLMSLEGSNNDGYSYKPALS